jgi:hypothetical protein
MCHPKGKMKDNLNQEGLAQKVEQTAIEILINKVRKRNIEKFLL